MVLLRFKKVIRPFFVYNSVKEGFLMGFQIFNFEDNSNVSVVNRKGIFKVIQYDKDLAVLQRMHKLSSI